MDDLKNCPFCGGHTMSVHTATAMNGELWSVVFCDDCGAESASGQGKNGATEKWNTRPIEDKLSSQLEQIKEEREKYRIASSDLCGAHIGILQGKCPVCQLERVMDQIHALKGGKRWMKKY